MSIHVEQLSFSYCTRPVLHDVSFSVEKGRLLAVLGPNGAGKTTLFRCILGLHTRYHGVITVDGIPAKDLSAAELARHVAYIPQIHGQAFSFTVKDMVLMGTAHQVPGFSSPKAAQEQAASEAMERMGISHLAQRRFSHLSGGEQQMVLIARALAQQARILLMDEPTASLDYGNQTKVLAHARALADEGYTILLSTHNPQHALWFADLALALQKGRVAAFGAPAEVLTPELIYNLYGVRAQIVSTPSGALISPEIHQKNRIERKD